MAGRYVLVTETPSQAGRRAVRIIPGVSVGGPAQLRGAVVSDLIEAERYGAHIVLLAAEVTDLDAAPAAVCRHVVTDDEVTAIEASHRYGLEWVVRVDSARVEDIGTWVQRLPRPESHTWGRRLRNVVRSFAVARAMYVKMTSMPQTRRRTP